MVENGFYNVTLKFAEIYFNEANRRVFVVNLEEQLVLDDFDIFAEAGGKNIALDKTFEVEVTDGAIDLEFIASVDNAKISAIEIQPSRSNSTILINTGGSAYTNGLGQHWSADSGFVNGSKYSSKAIILGIDNDTLTGGAGTDEFVFKAKDEGVDQINDFTTGEDVLVFSAAGFGGNLVPGAVSSQQFILGAAATTAEHRFIYDASNGNLFYDIDGTGSGKQVQIARLNSGLNLSNNDLFVDL